MKKIEKMKMMNKFRKCLLAYILIVGFALFFNANLSHAGDETTTTTKKMNFGGDMASGEAMYKETEDGFVAVLGDGTVINRYKSGKLRSMQLPTKPPSHLDCEEEESMRDDVNWLGGAWDYATAGAVGIYNYAETVVGSAAEIGKATFTDQTYDEAIDNIKDIANENMNDMKAHADELMSNFVSSKCTFDDGEQTYDYNLTSHGTIDNDKHALSGCKPMPLKVSELSSCFLCPLLNIVLAACDQMGALSINMFSKPIRVLLAVGLAIYLAMSVLAHISSFVKVDAAKFWQGVFTQSFKILIAYYLLVHPNAIYDYLISPILSAALEYGEALTPQKLSTSINADKYITRDAAVLSPYVYKKLIDFLISIQTNLSTTQAIGATLICTSNTDAMRAINTIMNFEMFFQGVIVYLFALLLSIAFAFYIIDSVASLGVLFGLMPLLIVAWPFKLTSGYTKKGMNILMTAAFTFIFISTMAVLVIKLIEASFGTDTTEMIKLFNEGKAKEIDALFDMTRFEFLSLIACSIFGFQFMATVSQFAKDFGGHSSGRAIAPALATRGASLAQGAANKATKPATKYAGEKVQEGWQKTRDGALNAFGIGKNTKAAEEINFSQGNNQVDRPKQAPIQKQPENVYGASKSPTNKDSGSKKQTVNFENKNTEKKTEEGKSSKGNSKTNTDKNSKNDNQSKKKPDGKK